MLLNYIILEVIFRLKVHKALAPIEKVDVSIQTNIQAIYDGTFLPIDKTVEQSIDSAFFLKEDEMQPEDYWDLDIDSAIVGDYNSVSEESLDELIDPHYAKINMFNDGISNAKYECVSDASIFNTSLKDRSNSNVVNSSFAVILLKQLPYPGILSAEWGIFQNQ